MMANAYQQYRRVQEETASGGQIILMLYAGAIRFLTRAETHRASGDLAAFSADVQRVQAILSELQAGLDRDIGGEVAVNLYSLYAYYVRRLTDSVVQRDTTAIPEVVTHLRDLRTTWEEAVQLSGRKHATAG